MKPSPHSLQAGQSPSPPRVPVGWGTWVGAPVGFHAPVYAPQRRVAMNLEISSLKSQGYQCPHECLSLTRDEGGCAPRLLGTPKCSRGHREDGFAPLQWSWLRVLLSGGGLTSLAGGAREGWTVTWKGVVCTWTADPL